MTEVMLTGPELWLGAIEGVRRRLANLKNGSLGRYGIKPEDAWRASVVGAIAEVAVARVTGRYWHPLGPNGVDVGRRIQVRYRAHSDWDLLLHRAPADNPTHLYVHVTGEPPILHVHGWVLGADVQREEFWGDPHGTGRPCYWVPRELLVDLERLPPDA